MITTVKMKELVTEQQIYFFLPLLLPFGAGAADGVEATLEARDEGAAELALLPLTLSSALFYSCCVSICTV